MQAKARRRIAWHERKGVRDIVVRVRRDHIDHWRELWEPVILTVWDAESGTTYWECVQIALERAERREIPMRGQQTVAIRVPQTNLLNAQGVGRIDRLTRRRFARFERERDGAKHLMRFLREEIGLELQYDPQYGMITLPAGKFVPDPEGESRLCWFGRAARDVTRLAGLLGLAPQDAIDLAVQKGLGVLQAMLRGEPVVRRGSDGEVIAVWTGPEDIRADWHRMLDKSDEE